MFFLRLLLFVVVFAAVAHKLQTPYPIVLVVAGLILGFVPGIPRIALNPDVIFLLVLPPLLYSAAWLTSWREFRYQPGEHSAAGIRVGRFHSAGRGVYRALAVSRDSTCGSDSCWERW